MKGWNGRLLRVDLTNGKTVVREYSEDLTRRFVGGRGFAVKTTLRDEDARADYAMTKHISAATESQKCVEFCPKEALSLVTTEDVGQRIRRKAITKLLKEGG